MLLACRDPRRLLERTLPRRPCTGAQGLCPPWELCPWGGERCIQHWGWGVGFGEGTGAAHCVGKLFFHYNASIFGFHVFIEGSGRGWALPHILRSSSPSPGQLRSTEDEALSWAEEGAPWAGESGLALDCLRNRGDEPQGPDTELVLHLPGSRAVQGRGGREDTFPGEARPACPLPLREWVGETVPCKGVGRGSVNSSIKHVQDLTSNIKEDL